MVATGENPPGHWPPPAPSQPAAPPQPPPPWDQADRWPAPGQPAFGEHPAPQTYPPPQWPPPPPPALPQPSQPRPLVGDERLWVPAAHLVALVTSWLGPLVILLTAGERSARTREQALESLNFEITFWLLMLLSALLTYVAVGFVFLILLPLGWLVLRLLAAFEAGRGRRYRYPFTLRLVR